MKRKVDGSVDKLKARLIVKEFHQTPSLDFTETFSSIVKHATVKVPLTFALHFGWDVQQLDINNCFLNDEVIESVFIS